MLSVWSEMQIACIWSILCHCHPKTPSSLVSFKPRLVLAFWYWLAQVVAKRLVGKSVSEMAHFVSGTQPLYSCVRVHVGSSFQEDRAVYLPGRRHHTWRYRGHCGRSRITEPITLTNHPTDWLPMSCVHC